MLGTRQHIIAAWSIVFFFCGISFARSSSTTIVEVPDVGQLRCNINGDNVTECLGIPFAASTAGQNRFRPPQALPLQGLRERNATAYGAACLQIPSTDGGVEAADMDEDCLNLNIWVPPLQHHGDQLPVFFWIYGGAGIRGSGRLYNLSRFAAQGVVAVTINYRLGALGWLPLEEIARESPQAPSNGGVNGLLDQIAAMRWVGQHISAFGGDPRQVTIAGESMGAMSICAHLHLPVSQGLFHRAVLESGSCGKGPWGWSMDGRLERGQVRAYLSAVGAKDLASLRLLSFEALLATPLFNDFLPNIDGWFMPKEPSELPMLTNGSEMLIGSNTMDSIATAPPWGDPSVVPNTSRAYAALVGSYFGPVGLALYPVREGAPPEDVFRVFQRLSADACQTCPKAWLAQKMLAGGNTVYMYHFGFWPKAPLQGLACHGCEVQDALDLHRNPLSSTFMSPAYEPELARAMSSYWASFAKDGAPQGTVGWPKYEGAAATAQYLNISMGAAGEPQIRVDHGLAAPQCEFFRVFVDLSFVLKLRFEEFCDFPVRATSTDNAVFV
mmetsp:Transcript_86048/g.238385  ORF Transcript_86048/g.238385 Transcript_86048/m.238385 type:complete len:555 (+) Transcript_86048:45-1709(+)|eukprot:CAMPEP_0179090598 /NCGR_PEP_ID=MMETSP0796-20121207/41341_1 /TAXON_ID=73915 /ORGANISM="Pyrodinium bahamense, Strain pbaha01" /LENGTH=554 /DNA_ID=CAMNT_0020788171 /DNA_START=35 /DNA_END=1699 /DNA_ORIENTATION=+